MRGKAAAVLCLVVALLHAAPEIALAESPNSITDLQSPGSTQTVNASELPSEESAPSDLVEPGQEMQPPEEAGQTIDAVASSVSEGEDAAGISDSIEGEVSSDSGESDQSADSDREAPTDEKLEFDISASQVDPIADQYTTPSEYYDYTQGEYITRFDVVAPKLVVTLNGTILTESVDYAIQYSDNEQPGTASVVITGMGEYCGSKTVTFTILVDPEFDISIATISDIADQGYDPFAYDDSAYLSRDDFTVSIGSKQLDEYSDYIYECSLDKATGTGTVTVTGRGSYYGTTKATYRVVAKFSEYDVRAYNKKTETYDDDDDSYETTVSYSVKNQTYTGRAITPKLTVELYRQSEDFSGGWYDSDGNYHENYYEDVVTLKEGIDYKLAYKNNVGLGVATISIVGKGVYTGQINRTFKITYPISEAKVSAIGRRNYRGKAIEPKPTVTCLGKTLKLGRDYTLSYKGNKQGGVATVIIKGKGNYTGSLKKTFKIYTSMKYVKVSKIKAQYLYKKAAKPRPTVKIGSTKLKYGRDYTLQYRKNKKAGTATVIIKGKGYYKGTKKVTFKIIAKGKGQTITMAEFNKIKLGMSYKEVKYLIGGKGKCTYSYTYQDYEDNSYYDEDLDEWVDDAYFYDVVNTTYEWKGNKAYSGASISFQDGYVISKNQWGL